MALANLESGNQQQSEANRNHVFRNGDRNVWKGQGPNLVHLAKSSPILQPLAQVYKDDYQFFPSFMKDFVRNQVYPRVQQYVPSSTRQGVDALRKILERNRELYRYEETDTGKLETMLRDTPVGNNGGGAATGTVHHARSNPAGHAITGWHRRKRNPRRCKITGD